jgi:hypothetical protein
LKVSDIVIRWVVSVVTVRTDCWTTRSIMQHRFAASAGSSTHIRAPLLPIIGQLVAPTTRHPTGPAITHR